MPHAIIYYYVYCYFVVIKNKCGTFSLAILSRGKEDSAKIGNRSPSMLIREKDYGQCVENSLRFNSKNVIRISRDNKTRRTLHS